MDDHSVNSLVRVEEDEDEFTSCCEDVEQEPDEYFNTSKESSLNFDKQVVKIDFNQQLDNFSVNMFFKGVSVPQAGDSGIGVIIERPFNLPIIQVQKKLGFYVDQTVANYLALLDGLAEATRNKFQKVYAFTDSDLLYHQIAHEERLENPLLIALRERILEHSGNFETFVLKHVPDIELERTLRLAEVAVGVVSFSPKCTGLSEKCPICCEDKLSIMMMRMKCAHKFCSQCMKTYVDEKLESSQVPIKCPQFRCKYYISTTECRSFLPVTCYELLEIAFAETDIPNSEKFYCPFPNCSVLLDPQECLSSGDSSSGHSDNSCVECPVCQRFICVDCGAPWHTSMSCEVYQGLPLEERHAMDIILHQSAQNSRCRCCLECQRAIEPTQGCYHTTCLCGHEFCYSCGEEYRDGEQMCECTFWDEDNRDDFLSHTQESEQWEWDTFNSLPMLMGAYSDQERSQLALIQRFLAGGFGLSDHHNPYQSPPRCTDSYADAMKDLHQLPWLERFVSVISDDDYHEDYIHIQ